MTEKALTDPGSLPSQGIVSRSDQRAITAESEPESREQHHQQKQGKAEGAGIADLQFSESLVIHVINNGSGGIRWPSLRHQEDLLEDLGGSD
jgi:hypothetical protein